jgi:hypothetical protein
MKKAKSVNKKRIGESIYVGKYEHLFNQRWTENEIKSLADEMIDWFEIEDNYWLKDFANSKKISNSRFTEFEKNNEYFSYIYGLCNSMQESKMVKLGMQNKGAMPIFVLKNISGWKDNFEVNNQISETELESLKAVAKREMENQL